MKKFSLLLLLALALAFLVSSGLADEKKDHVCFRILDLDKDGLVTYAEFEQVYENDEQKFKEADVDKNGKLTHDEYHAFLGHGSS